MEKRTRLRKDVEKYPIEWDITISHKNNCRDCKFRATFNGQLWCSLGDKGVAWILNNTKTFMIFKRGCASFQEKINEEDLIK